MDTETLYAAQKCPEDYRDLLVRVAGYSDYFNDMNADLLTEINMTGSRQHIQVKTLPFRIRFAFNSIIQIIEYFVLPKDAIITTADRVITPLIYNVRGWEQ